MITFNNTISPYTYTQRTVSKPSLQFGSTPDDPKYSYSARLAPVQGGVLWTTNGATHILTLTSGGEFSISYLLGLDSDRKVVAVSPQDGPVREKGAITTEDQDLADYHLARL